MALWARSRSTASAAEHPAASCEPAHSRPLAVLSFFVTLPSAARPSAEPGRIRGARRPRGRGAVRPITTVPSTRCLAPGPSTVPGGARCGHSRRTRSRRADRRRACPSRPRRGGAARAFLEARPRSRPVPAGRHAAAWGASGSPSSGASDLRPRRLRRRRHLRDRARPVDARELGADVEWHLPSRFDEGYGLSAHDRPARRRGLPARPHRRLRHHCRGRGRRRGARGLDVIVTDHHRPGERSPNARSWPRGGPVPLSRAVRHRRRVQARAGAPGQRRAARLDLVALATIADVVPLLDENRALAAAGLKALAATQRPGLRALMRTARVDPAAIDSGSVGFRLAPRINAAGRPARGPSPRPRSACGRLAQSTERSAAVRSDRPTTRRCQSAPAASRGCWRRSRSRGLRSGRGGR